MELLALLNPDPRYAAEIDMLAGDLGVSRSNVKRLVAQLQDAGFQIASNEGRVWIEPTGWDHAQEAAERYLAQQPD